MNDFDVLAVQKDLSGLVDIFNDAQDVDDFVLIDNCISKLTLGKKEVPIQFDKMLYSYDKNILVLIMKDSQLSTDDLEDFMHKKNIHFSKHICNKQNDSYKYDGELKEFSFVGEKESLKRAIVDCKQKENDDCVYYPNVVGKLELGYITDEGEYDLFGRMKVNGVVEFEDKMILLLKRQKLAGLKDRQIFDLLMETPVKTLVDVGEDVSSFKNSLKKVDKQLKKIS